MLVFILKSAITLALLYSCFFILLSKETFHRFNRAVLVGKKQSVPIRAWLVEAGFPEEHIRVADTVEEAIQMADAFPAEGRRVILLENDLPDNY